MFSTKEPILKIFDQIELEDHVSRVLFYEKHSAFIFALDESKQFYFTFHYIRSLFELGKYEHVLSEIDPLIEYVFLNEAHFLPFESFQDLLYKKAYSLFQLVKFEEAIIIGEQLVGMQPNKKEYQLILQRLYRAHLNFTSTGVRLIALVLIFFSAIIGAILWLVQMNQQETTLIQSFLVMISPCLLALGLLGAAHLNNFLKSSKMTKQLVHLKREKAIQRG